MDITFDPLKNARNVAERGLSFELVAKLDWDTAIAEEDVRKDYGERRVRVFGLEYSSLGPAAACRRDHHAGR